MFHFQAIVASYSGCPWLSQCLSQHLYEFVSVIFWVCLSDCLNLSQYLSGFVSVFLSICLSVFLSTCLNLSQCLYEFVSVFFSVFVSAFVSVFVLAFVCVCFSICLSICLCICLRNDISTTLYALHNLFVHIITVLTYNIYCKTFGFLLRILCANKCVWQILVTRILVHLDIMTVSQKVTKISKPMTFISFHR